MIKLKSLFFQLGTQLYHNKLHHIFNLFGEYSQHLLVLNEASIILTYKPLMGRWLSLLYLANR